MSEAMMEDEQTGEEQQTLLTDDLDQNAEPEVDEFLQRVMTDPDFAVQQIKKRDQSVSTQANRLKALESIEGMVQMAGGSDELMRLAQTGSLVTQNPALREVIQRYQETGRVELSQATPNAPEEEDEWIDPDVKKVRDSYREEMKELREQLHSLQQIAGAADVRSKEQRVEANIKAALKEFEGDDEAFKEAAETIGNQYKASLAAAERGDPTQAKLIDELAGPNGQSILESATLKIYKKHAAKLAGAQSTQRTDVTNVLGKSTDARVTNPSRPGVPQLPPLPKGRVSDDHVLAVLQAAKRAKGIR